MSKQLGTQKGQHLADLTEEQARFYVESLLWPNGPVCSHCKGKNVYRMEGESFRAGLLRCRDCSKQFTVTVGTIFEDSHLPLRVWVRAFHLICSSKKGISALQLQRNLGLGSYRTAWHLAHRVRTAMKCGPLATKLAGTVEVDETYVGGKALGKGHKAGWDNKTPVVSMVERRRGPKILRSHATGESQESARCCHRKRAGRFHDQYRRAEGLPASSGQVQASNRKPQREGVRQEAPCWKVRHHEHGRKQLFTAETWHCGSFPPHQQKTPAPLCRRI